MFSHASYTHLAINVLSLVIVWLMAQKAGESEVRLLAVFFSSSLLSLFIPLLFKQPVIGASAGIYGMVGYLLPDLVEVVPLPASYALFFLVILFENGLSANPWSKLFHAFGLTLGIVFRYMFDVRKIKLRENASKLGLGLDDYAMKGVGYPRAEIKYKV